MLDLVMKSQGCLVVGGSSLLLFSLLLLLLLLVDLPDDLAVEGLAHHLHHGLCLGVEIKNACALSLLVFLAELTKSNHFEPLDLPLWLTKSRGMEGGASWCCAHLPKF